MGGLIVTLKRFFTNKTTVTFVGILASLGVLVGFYLYRIEESVHPVRVPVANKDLSATDEITKDDIEYIKVSSKFLRKSDVIKSETGLIGKYVATGTSIPKGGMFFTTQVVEKKELPNSIFDEIPDGYTIYQLKVDNSKTYANSIFPGDKIDLWMKYEQNGMLIYGNFISNIEVLGVRDAAGQNVFDVTSGRTPAWLLFAVPTEMYRYLKIAEYVSGMVVNPVPSNNYYTAENGSTEYTSEELLDLIINESREMKG